MGTPAENLLKKIQELEAGQAQLKQEMSKLMATKEEKPEHHQPDHHHHHYHHQQQQQQRSQSVSPQRSRLPSLNRKAADDFRQRKGHSSSLQHSLPHSRKGDSPPSPFGIEYAAAVKFTSKQCLNILQSMGQSVHIFDLSGRIIYWNQTAENLYGYSASEALGEDAIELLVDISDFDIANRIINQIKMGDSWSGLFPVRKKSGEQFSAIASDTPLYDDGRLIAIICASNDMSPFEENAVALNSSRPSASDSSHGRCRSICTNKSGVDSQQPLQAAIASKISNLASRVTNKVRSHIRASENTAECEGGAVNAQLSDHGFSDASFHADQREDASSGASTPRGDVPQSHFGVYTPAGLGKSSPGKGQRF